MARPLLPCSALPCGKSAVVQVKMYIGEEPAGVTLFVPLCRAHGDRVLSIASEPPTPQPLVLG